MPQNVEIKARVHDVEGLRTRIADLAQTAPVILHQYDTFYRVDHGRLKLRRFENGEAELIAYHRPDAEGPKTSSYLRYRTTDPDTLDAVLSSTLSRVGRVVKTREWTQVGPTRIHLDQVEGLGSFLEFEVQEDSETSEEDGATIAKNLLAQLDIRDSDLVSGSYLDLLSQAGRDDEILHNPLDEM